MRCLTLFGTAGERPEWNERNRSRRYRSIPLADKQVVSQFPMVLQLLQQLGVDLTSQTQPESDLPVDWTEHTLDVFYVAAAKGSPYVPDQESFVIPYGIESVLGFGGVLPSNEFFVVILFSRVRISRETVVTAQAAGDECRISSVTLRGTRLETFSHLSVDPAAAWTARSRNIA